MKKILIIMIFIVFTMSLYYTVQAQGGCNFWCSCSTIQTVNVTIGNCSFTAKYKYAVCFNSCYFELIELNGIDSYCFANYTMKELVRAAQKAIVEQPWVTCPPDEGGCITALTGYASSCWKWDGTIGPSNPTVSLISCNNASCCTYHWKKCNGVATLISVDNGVPCQPIPEGCFEVCE
jgi:hypothetical protein